MYDIKFRFTDKPIAIFYRTKLILPNIFIRISRNSQNIPEPKNHAQKRRTIERTTNPTPLFFPLGSRQRSRVAPDNSAAQRSPDVPPASLERSALSAASLARPASQARCVLGGQLSARPSRSKRGLLARSRYLLWPWLRRRKALMEYALPFDDCSRCVSFVCDVLDPPRADFWKVSRIETRGFFEKSLCGWCSLFVFEFFDKSRT